MEFKTTVDPKARSATACAVIGVYEGGELSATAALVDGRIGGVVAKLRAAGDFAGKLGDSLLLPQAKGGRAQRVVLIGLGTRSAFGRKQYRKAVSAAAAALVKTGAADAVIYLAAEDHLDLDVEYRARIVAEVFRGALYKIPDLKTAPRAKAPRLKSVSVAVAFR